jgi:hypothetical protein
MKTNIRNIWLNAALCISAIALVLCFCLVTTQQAHAQTDGGPGGNAPSPGNGASEPTGGCTASNVVNSQDCGCTKANPSDCGCQTTTSTGQVVGCDTTGNDFIDHYLAPIISFLGAGVGLIVVIMIVVGGIQYSTSGGDPSKASAAKQRIRNALIALVAFGLMYSFLQFIVPNGIF